MESDQGQQFSIVQRGIEKHVPKLAEFIQCDVLIFRYSEELYKDKVEDKYLERVLSMSFNELLKPALIDVYNSYIPAEAREEISITTNDIVNKQFNWIK